MQKNVALTLIALIHFSPALLAQEDPAQYPKDAEHLFALARNLWAPIELQNMGFANTQTTGETANHDRQIRQACLYLQMATELASHEALAWQDLLPLFASSAINDPGRATDTLASYTALAPTNSYPVDLWLGYRLESFNDRQSRESFLESISPMLRSYPSSLSDTYTQLGLFAMERSDLKTSHQFFNQAYSVMPYNDEALSHLIALSPVETDEERQKTDLFRALRWRTRLNNNPTDLDALLQLIQTLDDLGGAELTLPYYQQAIRLLQNHPQPDQQLINQLQLKQIASSYSAQEIDLCQKLCRAVLKTEPDNLLATAMAIKLGTLQTEKADPLVTALLNKAATDPNELKTALEKVTWLYSVVLPDPNKALDFAQKFDNAAGQTPQSQSLLALAWTTSPTPQEALPLLDALDTTDPITALAWAQLHLANEQSTKAQDALYAINHRKISSGLIVEKIEETLNTTGLALKETPSPLDYRRHSALQLQQMLARFDNTDLDLPFAPEKSIRCFMRTIKQNDRVQYGDPILTQINLSNSGKSDLVLGQGNFINPHLLIYARITSSSKPKERMLVSHRYLGQKRVLPKGQSNTVTESLNIGPVRKLLEDHPQQSVEIEFSLCLNPIPDGQGEFKNKIPSIKSETLTIYRKGFNPTRKNMQRQYNAANQGHLYERLRAIHLLASLIREDQLAQTTQLDYPVHPVDHQAIAKLLRNQLTDPDFRIRAWTAHELATLPKELAKKLIAPLSQGLNDPHWFVQLMTANALDSLANISDYHQWAAKQSENSLTQRQAQLKLNQPWEIIEPPVLETTQPNKPDSPKTD